MFKSTKITKRTVKQQRGDIAEQLACDYLQQHGLQLKQRNFSCRYGEIDLIMQHNELLVFVEVRYRRHEMYGGALESVDYRKQQRIIHSAQYYLQRKAIDVPVRFDVIAVSANHQIDWVIDAFSL